MTGLGELRSPPPRCAHGRWPRLRGELRSSVAMHALAAALLWVAVALAGCGKYGPPRRVQRATPPPAAVEQQEQIADPEGEETS